MRHAFEYDFMAIGAHADDIELGCGGSIIKMVKEGKKGVLVDLSCASAATRGTSADRLREAQEAARLMGGVERINLGLPDAHLKNDGESQALLIGVLRKYRPKLLITHGEYDYHPDHNTAHKLVLDCWYKAGLRALYPETRAFRAHRLVFFSGAYQVEPDFAVDISQEFQQKMQAIFAYESQFKVPGSEKFEGTNYLSSPEFLQDLEVRHRALGKKINKMYAEAFWCHETPEVRSLGDLEGEVY